MRIAEPETNFEAEELALKIIQNGKSAYSHGNNPHHCTVSQALRRGRYQRECNENCIEYLLNTGADPSRLLLLHIAVQKLWPEVLDTLLKDKRVKVNNTDGEGNTALHIAVMKIAEANRADEQDAVKCLHLLLDHPKINVNVCNIAEQTPLQIAIKEFATIAIEILLQKCSHKLLIDNDVKEEQEGLSSREAMEIFPPLLKFSLQKTENEVKTIKMFQLLYEDRTESFCIFMKDNDVNCNASNGEYTFLQFAVIHEFEDVIQYLLKNKARPWYKPTVCSCDVPPIILAAKKPDKGILNLFLQTENVKEFINETDTDGNTCLYYLAREDPPNLERICRLLEKGADWKHKNARKEMALPASVITKLFDNSITVHGLLKDDKNEVKIDTRFILAHRELEMEHKQVNDDSESDNFNDMYPMENMRQSETSPFIERPSQHDEHTRALVHQSYVEGIAADCDWQHLQKSTDSLIKDGILGNDVVNSPTFTSLQNGETTSNDTIDVSVKARTQRINGPNTNSSVCNEASLKDDQNSNNVSEDDYIGGTAAVCPIQMTSGLECDSSSVPGVEALLPGDSEKMNGTLHPQDMIQCLQTDAIDSTDSPVNIALNETYSRQHTVEVPTATQPNLNDSAGLNCFSTAVKNIVCKFNKKCEGTSSPSFEVQRNGVSKENFPVIDRESQNIVDSIRISRNSLNSVTVIDCTRDTHSCERQPVPEMTFLHFLASIPQYRCVLTHNLVTIILAMKFQRIQYFIYLDLLIYALYLASLSCFMFSGFECLASENSSETSMICLRLLEQCQNITQNNNLCSHVDAMCSTDSLTCSIDWGKKRWPWSATCVWGFLALVIMRDVIIWISKITFWSQCQNLQCVTYKQKSQCQNLRCFFHKLKTTFYNWCFVLKLNRTALTVLILIQTQNNTMWNELTTLVIYFACLELVMIATHVPKVAEFARMPVVAAKNISIYGIIYFILTLGMFSCLFINQHLYQGKSVENMSGFSYNPGVWVQSIMAGGFDVSHLLFISVLAFIFLMGINLLNTLLANNIKNDLIEKCEKGAILVIIEFLYDFEHFVFQIGNKWLIHKVLLSSPKRHFTEFDNNGNSTFYFRNGVSKRYDMDLDMYLTICGKSSIPPQKLLVTELEEKFKSMQKSLDSGFDEIHFRLAEIEEKMAIHTTKCE